MSKTARISTVASVTARSLARSGWRLAVLCVLATSMPRASTLCYADVPQVIAYQGRLTEDDGRALTGDHSVAFRLYDAESGGQRLWEENHDLTFVPRDNGIFSIILGNHTPLQTLNFNQPLWMSLEVDREGEMAPRLRLTAAGYALNTSSLEGLGSRQFLRTDTDTVARGRMTLTQPGLALLIQPSNALPGGTKVLEIRESAGASMFSVDARGNVRINGDLAVAGTISGQAGATGGAAAQPALGGGLSADASGVGLLRTCADGQILKWQAASSAWTCSADREAAGGASASSGRQSAASTSTVAIGSHDDTELLSMTITKSQSQSVLFVIATVQLSQASGGDKLIEVKLLRDGTPLDGTYRARIGTKAGFVQEIPVTLQAWDAAPAGTYTFHLMARASAGGANATVRRLSVLELP